MYVFFNDTATTEIYTLSLHDALPISQLALPHLPAPCPHLSAFWANQSWEPDHVPLRSIPAQVKEKTDRKSTRLNSSHANISYAVFCLKNNHRYQTAVTSRRASSSVFH